jgi:dihydroorotase
VIIDLNKRAPVTKETILYKCGWSPFEGEVFAGDITHTFVNGNLVYADGNWEESVKGKRLSFNRK